MKKHLIQLNLNEKEYDFLKKLAEKENLKVVQFLKLYLFNENFKFDFKEEYKKFNNKSIEW